MTLISNTNRFAAKYLLQRGFRAPASLYLQRPFPVQSKSRIAIYCNPTGIEFAQIYPFLHYADIFAQRYGAAVRCHPVKPLLSGKRKCRHHADIVLFQTWFKTEESEIVRALESIRSANPNALVAFIDTFAHTDLRLGRIVNDYIDLYFKKSLFKNHDFYFKSFRGDTSIMEYYGDLFGVESALSDWSVPESVLPKLRLSPNFFTAPNFLPNFPYPGFVKWEDRAMDIQTRIGWRGGAIYQAMRQAALSKVRSIDGLSISSDARVSWTAYMDELRHAKLCLSPFGYGELCWRDIEAFVSGSVLIKPDMSHLETLPDLYEPGITYLPIRWDFSDMEDVVTSALRDPERCQSIAQEAYRRMEDYVLTSCFVDDMACLFSDPDPTRDELVKLPG